MLGTNVGFVWSPHIQQWPTMANKYPTRLAFVGINVGIVWPGLYDYLATRLNEKLIAHCYTNKIGTDRSTHRLLSVSMIILSPFYFLNGA